MASEHERLRDSSEYRRDVDRVVRDELGAIYVRLPRFHETFFGGVADLEPASEAVFKKCIKGSNLLFSVGWSGWPETDRTRRTQRCELGIQVLLQSSTTSTIVSSSSATAAFSITASPPQHPPL
jgi:hypothetical protein